MNANASASKRVSKQAKKYQWSDSMQVNRRSSTRHKYTWVCVCKRAVAQQHMDVHCTMYMFTTTTKNKSVTVCVYLFLYVCHSVQCTYMPAVNQRINKLLQAASKPTDQWQIGKAISGKMYIDQTAKMCVNHNIAYVCVCVRVKWILLLLLLFLFAFFSIHLLLLHRSRCFSLFFCCCFVNLSFKTEHNDNTHKAFSVMFILEVDER